MGEFVGDVRSALATVAKRPMILVWPLLFLLPPWLLVAVALGPLTRETDRGEAGPLAVIGLVVTVMVAVAVLVVGLGFVGTQRVWFVRPLTVRQAWASALAYAPRFVVAGVVVWVMLFGTLLLLSGWASVRVLQVVLAVELAVFATYGPAALAFEHDSPVVAVGRGVELLLAHLPASLPYAAVPVLLYLALPDLSGRSAAVVLPTVAVLHVASSVLTGATVFHYRRIAAPAAA